jgi:hypothetical protein
MRGIRVWIKMKVKYIFRCANNRVGPLVIIRRGAFWRLCLALLGLPIWIKAGVRMSNILLNAIRQNVARAAAR